MATPGARFDAIFGREKGGGSADHQRTALVREEWARLNRVGWRRARVRNLNRFALRTSLGPLGTFEIAAGETLAIPRPKLDMRDLGDAKYVPVPVMPIEIAREIVRYHEPTGGVVAWEGDAPEPEPEALEAARSAQARYRQRIVRDAANDWSRHHSHKYISDRQREAAREMFDAGLLRRLPEWVDAAASDARRDCPECGESILAAARVCKHCRSRIKPQAADEPAEAAPGKAAGAPPRVK